MKIALNIEFNEDLLKNGIKTLVSKGLDSDENLFQALLKNMNIN